MVKKIYRCLRKAIYDTIQHDGIEYGGYLAFLVMLSIFPFLMFCMMIAGFIGGQSISRFLTELLSSGGSSDLILALKPRIIEITNAPSQNIVTIAVLSIIWTASSIFEGLRMILNRCYRVQAVPSYLRRRLLSVVEFMVSVFLLSAIATLFTIVPAAIAIIKKAAYHFPSWLVDFRVSLELIYQISLVFIVASFIALVYSYLPSKKNRLRESIPGVVLVTSCSVILPWLFNLYLASVPSINIVYGSIAGIIIALLYFYFCSILLIVGAEFNYHWQHYKN